MSRTDGPGPAPLAADPVGLRQIHQAQSSATRGNVVLAETVGLAGLDVGELVKRQSLHVDRVPRGENDPIARRSAAISSTGAAGPGYSRANKRSPALQAASSTWQPT